MTDLRSQLQATLGSAYTIDRELGGGGMSRVFLADETALGRKVVVKVLPPDITAGVNVERFKREIQVSAKLQHPHIVPVLSTGEMEGVPYYTMPFVEGESLRARIVSQGPLSITDALNVLRDVSRALSYAHERGVAHRDIKPDNILLSGGSATVADFGIAKAISAAKGDVANPTLTSVGTSLGTPAYMAPEQAAADPATNHRADIYAFGCVAFEVLTGRPPFVEKNPQRLLAAHMGAQPPRIAELRPDTPPALAELVMKCLEKDADVRPQTAADLVRVLDTVTSGGGHAATPAILLGGAATFRRALAMYAIAFAIVSVVAKAAVVATGLPDWVFPGAILVMALGFPVLLFTAYAQRVARRAYTQTPTYTPGGTPSMQHGTLATLAIKASPHLNWNRATMGGVYALGAFSVLVASFMILRTLGIGPAGSLFAAGKMTERERLIVAEFAAPDSTLATLVNEAVRTNLSQSRVVSIMPPVVISGALQRMQKPASSRVDFALARDIAQREGVKAIVDGAIRPLGTGYALSLRLVSVDSSIELASFQGIAATPADLLNTVDELTRKLRGKIGESLKDVRGSAPLERVTTPSLDALRVYAEAARDIDTGGSPLLAAQKLREAIKLDTAFAMAWRKLGVALNNSNAPRPSIDSALGNAYRFRERLTEKERLLTEASYFHFGPGRDRRRAVQAYERLIALDPHEVGGANNLANIYQGRRDFARAESLYRAQIEGGRGTAQQHANLVNSLFNQGRVAEAERKAAEVRERYPQMGQGHFGRINALYQRRQYDSIQLVIRETLDKSSGALRANATIGLADYLYQRGQMRESNRLWREGQRAREALGAPPRPSIADSMAMMWDALGIYRDTAAAIRLAQAIERSPALQRMPPTQRPLQGLALFHARTGNMSRARALRARWESEVLTDSAAKLGAQSALHVFDALAAAAEGDFRTAIRQMWASDTTYDGPDGACGICVYLGLGEMYRRAGMPDSAIHYWEKYIETPWVGKFGNYADAVLHRDLAEQYERVGNVAKAAEYYRNFLVLWERADPELQPQVADVRRRLSRLADTERPR